MLSKSLESTLNKTLIIANNYLHEYATFEHLLLALLEDTEACKIFHKYNINLMTIYNKLDYYLQYECLHLRSIKRNVAKPTNSFQKLLQRAAINTHAIGCGFVTGVHILSELFFEADSKALKILKDHNLTRNDIIDFLTTQESIIEVSASKVQNILLNTKNNANSNNIYSKSTSSANKIPDVLSNLGENTKTPSGSELLQTHCINLNKSAIEGNIDALIGRCTEIQRTIEILCRRQKNNVILVGEPGVGKTAIAEGLALRITQNNVPDILKKSVIYALDIGSLVSGTRYRGDFEERIKSILQEIKNQPHIILFVDEIHNIIGAGSSNSGSLDASNLLKPALARGEIRCIGATTFKEFHKHFEKDSALVRRFQKIVVQAPSVNETISILEGLKTYYELHHNITYEDEAIIAAARLSDRYINDRNLPDKAIDLLDEAGSRKKINNNGDDKIVTAMDIEHIVSDIAQIPSIAITTNEASKLQLLEKNLNDTIFGQSHAILKLCSSIKLSRAGLKKSTRPIGCYIFAGPTGVGKTELATQMAKFCNMHILRFDMSEYSESHSISRLIGTPPGYSGFDQGGLLTEEIDKNPHSVVLFDEIEKANQDIFNLLLQIMDHGKLTDSSGKIVNFTNAIIIMTTNAGANKLSDQAIGFNNKNVNNQADNNKIISQHLDKILSAEFRGRLDEIIIFNNIHDSEIHQIIQKNLLDLEIQLRNKNIFITIDDSIYHYLKRKCHASDKGARMLDRIIDKEFKQRIADIVLFGVLDKEQHILALEENGEILFKFDHNITLNA